MKKLIIGLALLSSVSAFADLNGPETNNSQPVVIYACKDVPDNQTGWHDLPCDFVARVIFETGNVVETTIRSTSCVTCNQLLSQQKESDSKTASVSNHSKSPGTCSVYAKLQLSGFLVKSTCSTPSDAYNCTDSGCSYPSSVSNKASAYSFVKGHVLGKYSGNGYSLSSEQVTSFFQDSKNPKEFVMTFINH